MRPRVAIGNFLVRLGGFIQSLAVMVMRPDDLMGFSRQTYTKPESVDFWSSSCFVDTGLNPEEVALLGIVPTKQGRLLLLGIGGGREAIHLARIGFEITGIDFAPEMVEKARENAIKRGVEISGLVQEISKLDVPAGAYDIAWLSAAMYSSVPTSKRRIKMLKRIEKALKPGGYFICQFHWNEKDKFSPKVEFVRRAFAYLTLGNMWYEKGDMFWHNKDFIHAFSSKNELKSEFESGGFKLVEIYIPAQGMRGGAVLQKV
jgi:SAM-dependent methyltransferase